MSIRVIVFHEADDLDAIPVAALLYDATTGVPLPVESFESSDDAETFLRWLDEDQSIADPRTLTIPFLVQLRREWGLLNADDGAPAPLWDVWSPTISGGRMVVVEGVTKHAAEAAARRKNDAAAKLGIDAGYEARERGAAL